VPAALTRILRPSSRAGRPAAWGLGLLFAATGAAAQPPDGPNLPVQIEAEKFSGSPGREARAEGAVELRRGGLTMRADRLVYDAATERALAEGRVLVSRDGNVFRGPSAQMQVETFQGHFLQPDYEFARRKAGGHAERIDFDSRTRFRLTDPTYTSCPRDGSADPDWLLTASTLRVDLDANEAIAENARLRFLGVPVLALPVMTFPVTDERKSGWLAPELRISSQSGVEVGVPYYWNAAPNRDLTLTPRVRARRGAGLDVEARYLEPSLTGQWTIESLPHDRVMGTPRAALHGWHQGRLARVEGTPEAGRYEVSGARVSDDDWWRDFDTRELGSTPRLLPLRGRIEQPLRIAGLQALAYGQAQRWQAVQAAGDTFTVPYQRALQAGLRLASPLGAAGLTWSVETELNRFTLPDASAGSTRPTGQRLHLLGDLSLPWQAGGLAVIPRAGLNVAGYDLDQTLPDGRRSVLRAIPSFSVESALTFERETTAFGRTVRQTLEPRVVYSYTPMRPQNALLAFDSAPVDFGFASIYLANDFSGIDRVSDANRLNAGLVTRVLDAAAGVELLRLGIVQRYLLQDQQVTPLGAAVTERFSDVLLLGSTRVVPNWSFDATLRWNAQVQRLVRSVFGVGYSPGPGRSLSSSHRYNRDASEQVDVGGQWPLWGWNDAGTGFAPGCTRRWSGIGRADYSLREQRLTSTTLGLEVDAQCWKGRVVAQRTSTGVNQFATQLQFQIELTGLTGVMGFAASR
jgi:LPS-assembly protein